MTVEAVDELVADMHDNLAATAELDVDPRANRWLGEAEAVAADIAEHDLPAGTVRKRAGQIRRLLESAGPTDNDEAEKRVRAALTLARKIETRLS